MGARRGSTASVPSYQSDEFDLSQDNGQLGQNQDFIHEMNDTLEFNGERIDSVDVLSSNSDNYDYEYKECVEVQDGHKVDDHASVANASECGNNEDNDDIVTPSREEKLSSSSLEELYQKLQIVERASGSSTHSNT